MAHPPGKVNVMRRTAHTRILFSIALLLVSWFAVPQRARAEFEDDKDPLYVTTAADTLAFIQQEAKWPGAESLTPKEPVSVWIGYCQFKVLNPYGRRENRSSRYLVLRVTILNQSEKPLLFERQQIRLKADTAELTMGEFPEKVKLDRYTDGNYPLTFKMPSEIAVEPGKSTTFTAAFASLPDSLEPALQLELTAKTGEKVTVDVVAQQTARLGLVLEKIGPRQSLPIFTIHGALNSVNAMAVAKQVRSIVDEGQERIVVTFADGARPVETDLQRWLLEASEDAEEPNNIEMVRLPLLPKIRSLALSQLPKAPDGMDFDFDRENVFDTTPEAVSHVLGNLLRQLPPTELLNELRTGHAWSKSAILETCGDRLGSGAWPLLAEMSRSPDLKTRRLALAGLAHQENPQARAILQEALQGTDQESADSALRAILSRDDFSSRVMIKSLLTQGKLNVPTAQRITAFAEYYHPDWNEQLLAALRDADPAARKLSYQVLSLVGHPRLGELCLEGIRDENEDVRVAAFEALVTCRDHQFEVAAIDYCLQRLDEGKTSDHELKLIEELKVTRATPLLKNLIETRTEDRERVLDVFGSLADLDQLRWLVGRLDRLELDEQATVLQFSMRLPIAEQLELARVGLKEKSGPRKSAAMEVLQKVGSEEAVTLVAGLLSSDTVDDLEMACNTLSQIGNPQAMAHLTAFREKVFRENMKDLFRTVESAFENWRSSQPGYSYVRLGHYAARDRGEEVALKYFTLAIEMSPNLSAGYAARGNMYLKRGLYDKAEADFNTSVKLDSFDSQGLTGVGLILAIKGQWEKGLEVVLEKKRYYSEDATYSYNTACVMGRALEYLEKQPDSLEKAKHVANLRERAIHFLDESLHQSNPFEDFEWMQEDPDLASLRALPEFQRLIPESERKSK